ncbi:hypothetical protein HW537_00460 [Asaia siamensis]
MVSFDHRVFQRLFGGTKTGGSAAFAKRRERASGLAARFWPAQGFGETDAEGLWPKRKNVRECSEVEVRRHDLGQGAEGAVMRCDATGWGMVVSGCARLEMCSETGAALYHDMLHEGDVWSVPASASAWLHCRDNEHASVVVFVGGRETEADVSANDWCWADKRPTHGPFHHTLLDQTAETTHWGSIRVLEADAFADPDALSAALVEISPGRCTDLHWHLNTSVWQVCLEGSGAVTCVPAGQARQEKRVCTGMIGHVPKAEGYFIRNDGNAPLRVLQIFRSDHYHDLSLSQWLAASSPELIAAHLCVDVATISSLSRL